VHAIEQYSPQDWDQLWREQQGRVCGLLSEESPPAPRSRRAVLVGALLTAISPLLAQTGRVRIRVIDATGAVVTTAEASLLGADAKPTKTVRANDAGEIAFSDLPFGECRFSVVALGFNTRPLLAILRNSDEVKLEAILDVGSIGTVVSVEPATVETVPVEPRQTPARSTPAPEPKRTKRKRWWIFR
jgi:hypothetical protein